MRTLPKYLTQDEIRRFFNAIDSVRDRALFSVIYHYGLRVDEATPLTTNWLQVSGTAELAQIDQRVRHQLHAIVPLLDAFKA
jgi:integrase